MFQGAAAATLDVTHEDELVLARILRVLDELDVAEMLQRIAVRDGRDARIQQRVVEQRNGPEALDVLELRADLVEELLVLLSDVALDADGLLARGCGCQLGSIRTAAFCLCRMDTARVSSL